MEVQTYILPIGYFPRLNYAYKNSLDIYSKYRSLTADFVEEEAEIPECEGVVLRFCKKKTDCQFPAEVNEIVRPKNVQSAEITQLQCDVSTFLNEQPKKKGSFLVTVLDFSLLDETTELTSGPGLFVFITNSLPKTEGNLPDNCVVTTKDRVGSDICNHLEKTVLKPMNEICVFLERIRKSFSSMKYKTSRTVPITSPSAIAQNEKCPVRWYMTDLDFGSEAHTNVTSTSIPLTNTKLIYIRNHSTIEGQYKLSDTKKQKFMEKKFHNITDLHEHAFDDSHVLEQIDTEAVESLLKSIKVLYGMSNIPENEQPHILDDGRWDFSEELCADLFSISKCVKGVGKYCSTVRVLVADKAAEKEPEVREQIKSILKQHGQTKYEIVEVSEYKHLMHVGAKLEPVSGYGTLGCFAKMGERTCILLSGHVAKCGSEMYFENKRKVCKILKETTTLKDGDLDIAAAEINHQEVICSSDFMDSEGNPMRGELRDYIDNDKVITEEQKVHIWGASSKPGKGVITTPKLVMQDEDCKQVLMQIKDGDTCTKFASEGDSGAIVCTDDPDGNYVHVLGMVMGQVLQTGQAHYLALPLSDGLKQLERKTGQKFELC